MIEAVDGNLNLADELLVEIEDIVDDEIQNIFSNPVQQIGNLNDNLFVEVNHGARKCPVSDPNTTQSTPPSKDASANNSSKNNVGSNDNNNHNERKNDDQKDDKKGDDDDDDDDDDDEEKNNRNNPNNTIKSGNNHPIAKLTVIGETSLGWITFDASKSMDSYGNPCTFFVFDFGDETPPIAISSPMSSRFYRTTGIYKISVTVLDRYGQSDTASIIYEVKKTTQNSKNAKNKKKSKLEMHRNYDPPCSLRAKGRIRIQRGITEKIIPTQANVESIVDLYSYLDKLTALQWNDDDDNKHNIDDIKVMDYDLHDMKNDQLLYCLIRRQDELTKTSRRYKWIMDKKLYTRVQLNEMRITPISTLKSDLSKQLLLKTNHEIDSTLGQKIINKLQSISLKKIQIYNKPMPKKRDQMLQKRLTLTIEKFRKYCKNNTDWKALPIVMSYHHIATSVEWLTIIKTEPDNCDIGISFKYNYDDNESIFITGFHIDKSSILEQHQLAMPSSHNSKCTCLDSWNNKSNITHLIIGNPGQDQFEKHKLEQELANKQVIMDTMMSVYNINYSTSIYLSTPSFISSTSNISATSSSSNYTQQTISMDQTSNSQCSKSQQRLC